MENEISKVFRTFEQRDKVLTGLASKGYVRATPVLPPEDKTEVGSVYLLTKFCRDFVPGIIYILNEIDGVKMWMDITVSQIGHLPKAIDFWKRITKDSIILHWTSPENVVDQEDEWKNATWDYDVVVRKFGEDPSSPEDGEILGYSTIHSQYAPEDHGFIVPLSEDDPDYDYHYAVFSCTISNVWTRSDVLKGSWDWQEIKDVVNANKHRRAFRVGDVIPMPDHRLFGVLHAVIMDFDRAPSTTNGGTPSIFFQIQEVLGNMSFDNRELEYARTSDIAFMRNRDYFVKTTEGEMIPIEVFETKDTDPTRAFIGGSIQDWRSRHISIDYVSDTYTDEYGRINGYPIVYVMHPSIAYWVANDTNPIHPEIDPWERWYQSCIWCGDSNYRFSNMREWLSRRLGLTPETYLEYDDVEDDDSCHCGGEGCTDGCTCKHSMKKWWNLPKSRITNMGDVDHSTEVVDAVDMNTYWKIQNDWDDFDWAEEINGWFSAVTDNWHNVAPAELGSACYIDKIPFQDGWPVEFTDLIYPHRCITITDEILWRYMRGGNQNTSPTYDAQYINGTRPVIAQGSERFWLPSYEEIYGRRPVNGYNGEIDAASVAGYSEGDQFAFYRDNPDATVKFTTHGEPMAWYLRSCDPTTVGRVFYVENYVPDPNDDREWTCIAHREGDPPETRMRPAASGGGDSAIRVGPSPCFIIRQD